jgi:hypothetical protein
LKVTAKRLDGPAPPAEIVKANSSYREQDWKAFLVGGINFPTPGCWEVSGRYESDELTFVVWVVTIVVLLSWRMFGVHDDWDSRAE